ncbi:AAA family ATPase [Paenibacillus sp. XY044]|uniref:AAA family ATPase n=1 Tax=Paenibacillus sp. XY044 TaxID=2026089 RepID=UPI000B97D087|nr:AAA family ATPase [Paenibacillus sp. XY044]OZB94340.1 hypothetical protein CJP46_19255 [Paenibacillus sp. XY044]
MAVHRSDGTKAPDKIRIIGSVGSGKSTLARALSEQLGIPYYELDNMVWRRTDGGDVKNSFEERDRILNGILEQDQWIIEGVHYQWVQRSFADADLIVYVDTPIWVRNYRILKRFTVQKLGLEQGNYQQSFGMLRKMYKWNYRHAKKEKPEIMQIVEPYRGKLLVINNSTVQQALMIPEGARP